MNLIRTGKAGTLESSDVMITVKGHSENRVEIKLKSIVEKRFGRHIRRQIEDILERMEVNSALVDVDDRGALDCVIQARLETALYRAAGIQSLRWEEIQ
ncbi:MAG TPA: citrate lyase acyl carrier protein [Sediminispirochaeta sp.]|nr:citrate lyase acyl carrier protein [Sediminispirochaeta sp.]